MTGVLILPQRPTVLVAGGRSFSIFGRPLPHGSGCRLELGRIHGMGRDFGTRGARMDEQIHLLRRLWSEQLVTHHGRFEHVEPAGMVVFPRKPIQVWMGGFSEPAFRRAGRLGDGFIFDARPDPNPEHWARVRHHLREAGRDETQFGKEFIARGRSHTVREIADALKRGRDAGYTHGSVEAVRRGYDTIDAHIGFIAELRHCLN